MADTPPTSPQKSEAKDTLRFFLKLALFVFILRSFIVTSFVIPSESMLPRLLIGDYLFVTKWNYGYSRWSFPFGLPLLPGRILGRDPARGDVVVFRSPEPDDHDVIKRVIGLPGDTIQVTNGQVILNGRPVPKQRIADFILPLTPNFTADKCGAFLDTIAGKAVCRYPQFRETLPDGKSYNVLDQGNFPEADDTGVYRVPADHVFLMGDNRDDSADSRFAPPRGMGMIPMNRLEGRAAVVFFSTDGSAEWIKPWTWVSAARWDRIGGGF